MLQALWLTSAAAGAIAGASLLMARMAAVPALGTSIAVAAVLMQWEFNQPVGIVTVAGAQVQLFDVFGALLLGSGLIRIVSHARIVPPPILRGIMLAALGLLTLSLVRGGLQFGIAPAVNEARSFLLYVALAVWLYSLCFGPLNWRETVDRVVYLSGWGLCLLATYHVAVYGFGSADEFVDPTTGLDQVSRCLVAGQALALLLALCRIIDEPTRPRAALSIHRRAAPIVFLAVIVASQQRTVWAATAVALVVFLVRAQSNKRLRLISWAAPCAIFGYAGVVLLSNGEIVGNLRTSFESLGTLRGRLDSQNALLDLFFRSNVFDMVFGKPFGNGYARFEEGSGRLVEYSPHSAYFLPLLRTGVLGLLIYSAILLVGLRTAVLHRHVGLLASLAAIVVFGWAYAIPWYCLVYAAPIVADVLTRRIAAGHLDDSESPNKPPLRAGPDTPLKGPRLAAPRSGRRGLLAN